MAEYQMNDLKIKLGRCEASWGEPERDMMVSVPLSDSVSSRRIDLKTLYKVNINEARAYVHSSKIVLA